MPGVIGAGAQYFALVFGAGFVLGIARVLWLAPRIGERAAELVEMPVMLAIAWLAAGWTVRRHSLPAALRPRLGTGAVAVALLLVAEFGLVLPVRGLSVEAYFAARDPVAAAAYYAALAVVAVLPALTGARRPAAGRLRLRGRSD